MLDVVHIDQLGAVGAEEDLGIEAFFEVVQAFGNGWFVIGEVNAAVVAFGFDQHDIAHFYEPAAVAIFDEYFAIVR